MKRSLIIILAVLLFTAACTAAPNTSGKADDPMEEPILLGFDFNGTNADYADFSDVLSAALIDGTQNRNLSPISVYLALAMVTEGAVGDTQEELLRFLGCKTIEELRGVCAEMLETLSVDRDGSTLALADSLWMADRGEKLTFRDDFLKVLTDTYRSEAKTVRFGTEEASKQIADWITEHTNGKIEVSPDFSPDTVAVLINTIYLKDAWMTTFYESATEQGTFFSPVGEKTVDYMQRLDNGATIIQGDGFLRYSLGLCNVGRMVFVLPDEGVSLSGLVKTPESIRRLLVGGEKEIRANVSLKLPKFKFQDKIELKDVLEALGLTLAMSGAADFTAIANTDSKMDRILQESYISVNEDGVEATAYTMVVACDGAMMPEELPEIDFHLTRPFLYAIESYDGTVLFIGTVTVPGEAE